MNILVTGGAGYLGCWVTTELLKRGHFVRIFDKFCFGKLNENNEILWATHPNIEVIEGDIRHWQKYPNLFDGINCVIHLAGLANEPSCLLSPPTAYEVNVDCTIEIARQCIQRGVKKFVYPSTCAVYGKTIANWVDEESSTDPISLFSKTKKLAEENLIKLANESLSVLVLRLPTLFGYSPRMRFDLALNQMVATAKLYGKIEVRGRGNQWRAFLNVRDCAEAIAEVIEKDIPATLSFARILNLGSNDLNIRIIDLAKEVSNRIPGTQIEVLLDDEDLRTYRVRFDLFSSIFKYTPQRKIKEGIEEVLEWLETHPDENPFDEKFINVFRLKKLRSLPVKDGGEPVSPKFIPLAKPLLGREEEEAVLDCLRSGWITSGPNIRTFEQNFARLVGAEEAVAVSSCTSAIHLCLVEAGVKPGDEVITPPITWISTINTILNMGAKPIFVDVEEDTLNINPELIEEKITDRTKAIIPVDLAGHPCELNRILDIAEKYKIRVIEDSAHALGAKYHSKPIGSIAERTCFSFYATKNITTIEGGMISLQNDAEAKRLRILATNGLVDTAWDRYGRSAFQSPQDLIEIGFKYSMSNLSAGIGVQQLKKLPEFNNRRKKIAELYKQSLSEIDEIILPSTRDNVEHAWHLFIIRLNLKAIKKSRDEIAFMLRQENIGTGIHFYGVHLHPLIQNLCSVLPKDLPVATKASYEILSLPIHPNLTDEDVNFVVESIKKVIYYSKHN
ncbi:MAG: aminotransferase class I/II-fold pyridoxal phosphate-dependent enzyme [Candidatus Hydrogenedentes bacterium]|nr:aminotransferase class I/II-fold pyridoxal phosphate-dependent enzyme [Candidatus Hydrogenedentota bacterium]